jgi:hypothetical protein
MEEFLNQLKQLSTSDWIQMFAAIGQCTSGVGALIAAWFAYITIRQMRQQSEQMRLQAEVERKGFIAQYGPKLYVKWSSENHVIPNVPLGKRPSSKASGTRA